MFKELLNHTGILPCKELDDWRIDKIYSKFASIEGISNQNPITENRFP